MRGVVLRGGEAIDAPVVVSNADLKRTVLELVGAEHFAPAAAERVRGFRMSLPLFTLYLALDVDLGARGVPNTNYWIWGSYDIDGLYDTIERGSLPDVPLAYLSFASLKDPTNPHLAPRGLDEPPDHDAGARGSTSSGTPSAGPPRAAATTATPRTGA